MWRELIATGFYLGRFRYAPGTIGTLLGGNILLRKTFIVGIT